MARRGGPKVSTNKTKLQVLLPAGCPSLCWWSPYWDFGVIYLFRQWVHIDGSIELDVDAQKVLNSCFNRRSTDAAPSARIVFLNPNHRAKCTPPLFLTYQRSQLTHAISFYYTITVFVAFGVCTTHFKFTKPTINCFFRRCGITFLLPIHWLFKSFSHQIKMRFSPFSIIFTRRKVATPKRLWLSNEWTTYETSHIN